MKNSSEQNIEYIVQRMLTDRSVDAPADAIKYARNLYRARAMEPKTSMVQRVLAVMRSDLAPNRAAFGERSAAGAGARQVLFASGDHGVDLRITAAGNGFDIRGQILGEGFENGEIEIANDDTAVTAKIDETSEFKFTAIPAGQHSVTIRGTGVEIVIEELTLG